MKKQRYLPIILLFVIFLLFTGMEHINASPYDGSLPYETWLQKLHYNMIGPVGKGLALIIIVGLSAMFFLGGELNSFVRNLICLILFTAFLVGVYSFIFG